MAAVGHERAHLSGQDNFKNALARLCSDTLASFVLPRTLEAEWIKASEEAADDRACNGDRNIALDLASALIKVARIAPTGVRLPFADVMAFSEPLTLAHRVQRLTQFECNTRESPGRAKTFATRELVLVLITLLAAVSAFQLVMGSSALARAHWLIEIVVNKFQ